MKNYKLTIYQDNTILQCRYYKTADRAARYVVDDYGETCDVIDCSTLDYIAVKTAIKNLNKNQNCEWTTPANTIADVCWIVERM